MSITKSGKGKYSNNIFVPQKVVDPSIENKNNSKAANEAQCFSKFGSASKQRGPTTLSFGGKPDDKTHQQNAGSG